MNALEDSQEDQSQDLFEDDNMTVEGSARPEPSLSDIMQKLNKMDKKMDGMEKELTELKALVGKKPQQSFSIDNCSFKKKLNVTLKRHFTQNLWLDPAQNVEFKEEINRYIRQEGFAKDASAYRQVLSHANSKFADFRNQLRRRIFKEMKDGKDLQILTINEFTTLLMGTYFKDSGESCESNKKCVTTCLLLRSFLYKQKLFFSKEAPTDFWDLFQKFFASNFTEEQSKLNTLHELDQKRMNKRRDALGKEN